MEYRDKRVKRVNGCIGKPTEKIDVDFLKVVNTAELVEFMMDLVVDQRLVIVGGVVLDNVVD